MDVDDETGAMFLMELRKKRQDMATGGVDGEVA